MQEKSKMTLAAAKAFMQQRFGCSVLSQKRILTLDDFELYTCPCQFFSSSIIDFLEANRLLKKGVLPFSGGYLEQPYKFVEINNIIEDFILKKQQEEEKKAKMKKKK